MKRKLDWVKMLGRGVRAVFGLALRLADKATGAKPADVGRMPGRRGAPPAHLVRWRISYVDTDGVITDRVVRVRRVDHRAQQLYAWCETRQAIRTFKLAGVRAVRDADTGRPVNVAAWKA